MTTTFIGLTYDAVDAHRLASFWAAVLRRDVAEGASADHATVLSGASDSGPRISFHRVPEAKSVKNRLHADLLSNEHDLDLRRLLELGATVVAEQRHGTLHWTTLADPEGNEFDLIAG